MPDGTYIKVNYTLGSKQGLLMIKLKKSKIVLDWYFKEHFTFPIRISCSLRVVGKLFFFNLHADLKFVIQDEDSLLFSSFAKHSQCFCKL